MRNVAIALVALAGCLPRPVPVEPLPLPIPVVEAPTSVAAGPKIQAQPARHLGMSIPPTVYYDGTGAKIGSAFLVQFPSGFTGALSAGKAVLSASIPNSGLANSTITNSLGDAGAAVALGGTIHHWDVSGYAAAPFTSGSGNVTIASFAPNSVNAGWVSCSLAGEWNIKDTTDQTKNAYIKRSGSASKSTGSWVITGQTLNNFNPASEPYNGLLATDGTIISFQIDSGSTNGNADVYWSAICQ